ncbi:MAG: glutamine--fructose-6-phosphate transaminase (isomerizing), partial [Patescibacteria group bacterium]|nr:glutamine--fructose-6-phosphate transaminase (isomerizing) [Patescibacteria group bacterium]
MCGIVGYVGAGRAAEFLVAGLYRLEYRGYDSAGVATVDGNGALHLVKTAGRIRDLQDRLSQESAPGSIGIGHTRWATHGAATTENAHPHLGGDGELAVVHNGVIENHAVLRQRLVADGYQFQSQTDTEVIGHLIAQSLSRRGEADFLADDFRVLAEAMSEALAQLQGTFGVAVLFRRWPNLLVAARRGSPLIVGVGRGEHFIASDASPLVGRTDRIVYLGEHELAVVTADDLRVVHRDLGRVRPQIEQLEVDSSQVELGQFEHYMLKEIFEQPETIRAAMAGRIDHDAATAKFGGLNLAQHELRTVDRFLMTACGTSWHAALVGEYQMEALARIPVEVEYASELRYRNPPMSGHPLVFAITQSGETADTLAALRELKRKGYCTLGLCNVVGSTIAQESDG